LGIKTPPLRLLEKLYFPYLKQHKLFSIKYLHHIVAVRDEKCTKTHLRPFLLQQIFSGSLSLAIGGERAEGAGEAVGKEEGERRARAERGKCQNTPT
jgi:hypothetical protein